MKYKQVKGQKLEFQTVALLIGLLLISSSGILLLQPCVSAHSPPQSVYPQSFIAVSPNPIGVGQTSTIYFGLTSPPPTANGVYGDRWIGMSINVVCPDGTALTLGPFTSDNTGKTATLFTPDRAGNYSFQMHYSGQTLQGLNLAPGTDASSYPEIGDNYQPSNSSVYVVTVQAQPIAPTQSSVVIQSMIDGANAGDTVNVPAGYYVGNIVINKPLALLGAGSDATVIDGNATAKNVVEIAANNVKIDGFTLQNSVLKGTGIFAGGTSLNRYSNIQISNNQIRYCGSNLEIDYCSIVNASDNAISANYGSYGVMFNHSSLVRFVNNLVTNCKIQGLVYFYCDSGTIANNQIIDNTQLAVFSTSGAVISTSNSIMVCNNTFSGNAAIGLALQNPQTGTKIYHNTLSGNNEGLQISGSGYEIYENTIQFNDVGILYGHSNNTVYHNNIITNNFQARPIVGAAKPTWDNGYPSGGNYWSDYRGSDADDDGIGDTAYVVNEDNSDRYPLMDKLDLPTPPVLTKQPPPVWVPPTPPPTSSPSTTPTPSPSPSPNPTITPTATPMPTSTPKPNPTPIPTFTPTPKETTDLNVSCISSTSYSNFRVEITGTLTSKDAAIAGETILLSYSVNGGSSWIDLVSVNSGDNGNFRVTWTPSATGNYLIKAIWAGNATYNATQRIVSFVLLPLQEQSVFAVASNSTVTSLFFNSTSQELGFTVNGTTGTNGYVSIYLAKSLVSDASALRVTLDGNPLPFVTSEQGDTILVTFTYHHSVHQVTLSLNTQTVPSNYFEQYLILAAIVVALTITGAAIVTVFKKSEKRSSIRYSD